MTSIKEFLKESVISEKKFESGAWHGNNAYVLYDDGDEVTIIVGDYNDSELKKILKGFESDSPEFEDKYGEYVVTVDKNEWEEQQ